MAPLKVAVVGCTGPGRAHLGAWSLMSGVTIAAVCDTNGSAVARMADRFEDCAAFTDPRLLLESSSYDIVDVCCEPESRFDVARRALQHGAHVTYEIPLAANEFATADLVQTANLKERLLMPFFSHRFHAGIRFVKELIDNDDIGRPVRFRLLLKGDPLDSDQRGMATEDSYGALSNLGIHGVDLFRWFCGDIVRQSSTALLGNTVSSGKHEDSGAVLLKSVSGALGVIEFGPATPGFEGSLEIYATAGACLLDYETGIIRLQSADHPAWRQLDSSGPDRYESALGNFADAVRGLQKLETTGLDDLWAAEVCTAIYRNGAP